MGELDTIRVLAVNHTGLLGGAERSLLELLVRDAASGATETAIACPPGELADAAEASGITVLPISSFEFGFKSSWAKLPALVLDLLRASVSVRRASRSFEADLIHANSPRATMISSLASIAGRVPIITHIRDVLPTSRRGELARSFVRWRSSRVVANSRFTAESFRAGSGRGVDVVYNLLGPEFTNLDPAGAAEFRSELELGDALLVGIVGQLTEWKGQDIAIRAFAEALDENNAAKLVVVGSAKFATVGSSFENQSYEQKLHDTVRELGLEDRVVFAGQRAKVSGPMQAFAVTLMPSRAEPFGRAAIEAMACGSAVVATTIGGTVEFITDGESGLLRNPKQLDAWVDAIRALTANPELRDQLAMRGQAEVVRRFSAESPETQVVPIYREILKR